MPLGNPHLCLEKENCCLASQPRLAGVCISPGWNVCVCVYLFLYVLFFKLWWRGCLGSYLTLGVDIWGLKKEFAVISFKTANASSSPGIEPESGAQRRASPSGGWRPQSRWKRRSPKTTLLAAAGDPQGRPLRLKAVSSPNLDLIHSRTVAAKKYR